MDISLHIAIFHFPETQLVYTVFKGRLQSIIVVFGLPVHGMFWRVETINKAIFVIELNP